MNTEWDLYRLFLAVARAGSVNKAATALKLSQPTLSRRLGELERQLGAPLFFRTPAGVTLTHEGEELYRSALAVQATFDAFERQLHGQLGARSNLIKISTSEGLTRHWLVPRIAALRRRMPQVLIQIEANIQRQSLADGDLDFVIRMGDPGEGDLFGRRVGSLGFGLFASQDYLARRGAPASLSDLTAHDFVGGTSATPAFKNLKEQEQTFQLAVAAASKIKASVRLHPMTAQHAAVAQGLGLAVLAAPFAQAEGLVRVLPDHGLSADVWLLRRRESDLRPLVREVWRFLDREFASSQAWLLGAGD